MKTLEVFILFTVLILNVNMVNAVPPVSTAFSSDTGLDIQANVLDYYKINTSAELHIFIFNISSGAMLSNGSVSCEAELTDKTGNVIMAGTPIYHLNHFLIMRNDSVVIEPGIYGLTIVCNTSEIAGVKTAFFEATTTGNAPPGDVIILGFIIILLTIFMFIVVYLIRSIGLIVEASFDILDIAYAWGLFFGLLGVNLFAGIYLGNIIINDFLDVLVKILAFPLVILPIVAFFLSLFRSMKKEKEKKAEW